MRIWNDAGDFVGLTLLVGKLGGVADGRAIGPEIRTKTQVVT